MESRRLHLILFCLGAWTATAQPDSTTSGGSGRQLFVATQYNVVEFFSRSSVEPLFSRWKSDTVRRLVIAHLGDSHIQPGVFTGVVAGHMQAAKGFGGYGMMFPYTAAKTYSPIQYKTAYYGRWLFAKSLEPNPKLPLGVSGATVRTYDSVAGFSLAFAEPPPAHYRKVRLYFKGGPLSYDLRLHAGANEIVVPASQKPEDVPFMEVVLPDSSSTFQFHVLKTGKLQSQFEFYGMTLESATGQGLVYHTIGVGGAPFTSLLKQVLLDSQLPTLEPDLVILDFGTNDFLYSERIAPDLDREIVQAIRWIRQLVPDVTILLTSTQDMDRNGVNISAAKEFSSLIRRVARAESCALYDWYRVSGGQYAMSRWVDDKLARADHIHLTPDGYLLKGKLFCAAFEQALQVYSAEPGRDSLVLSSPKEDSINAVSLIRTTPARPLTTIRHEVRSGETLSTIAEKYGVRVSDIMRVNRLSSTTIIAGSTLTIEYAERKPVAAAPVPPKKNAVPYQVKSGDTLSEIAEQFNVSVKAIKKMNGLRSSEIVEGSTLWIPRT